MTINKILLVLFSFFFLLGVVQAVDIPITGCMDLNADHFGNTLVLQNDINGWATVYCFRLTSNGAGQNITIDLNNHFIDTNSTNKRLILLENYDLNSLSIINGTTYIRESSYFYWLSSTDINYLYFAVDIFIFDSYIIYSAGVSNNDLYLDFANSYINSISNSSLFAMGSYSVDNYTIFGLTGDINSLISFYDSNINNVFIINSDLNINSGSVLSFSYYDDIDLDLNFYNSQFDLQNIISFFNISGSEIGNLEINDLNVTESNSDDYLLRIYDDGNVNNLNFYNNDITFHKLISSPNSGNIFSGTVYNNIFRMSPDVNFIDGSGISLDFNSELTLNLLARQSFFIDDSNYIGGNLWLFDNNGYNICSLDDDHDGICDNSILIRGTNNYDYIPLLETHNVDLKVLSLDLNLDTFATGEVLDANLVYTNLGTSSATSDYVINFYINDGLIDSETITADLLSESQDSFDFAWTINQTGDVDINICMQYTGTDWNRENDCITQTIYVYTGIASCKDINASDLNKSNYLINDISGWNTNCFRLNTNDVGYFELNCNGHNIDFNADNQNLFDSNGYDLNSIIFRNCDIYNSYLSYLIKLSPGTDINQISFLDSNIDTNYGAIYSVQSISDSYLYLDGNGTDFNLFGSARLVYNTISNFSTLSINNFDLDSVSSNILMNLSMNPLNLEVFDSNISTMAGFLTFYNDLNFFGNNSSFDINSSASGAINLYGDNKTINLSNLNINQYANNGSIFSTNNDFNGNIIISDSNMFIYSGSSLSLMNGINMNIDFSTTELSFCNTCDGMVLSGSQDINLIISGFYGNPRNMLRLISDQNIINLGLTDSNLLLGNSLVANMFSNDGNISSGLIYNNIFYIDLDNNFIDSDIDNFNVDFNTSLEVNDSKRENILNDVATKIGGNLWLYDNNGENLCSIDSDYDGICDTNITLTGYPQDYVDYLPLILDYPLDVGVLGLPYFQFWPALITYLSEINLQVFVSNFGDVNVTAGDFNTIFYYSNSDSNDGTTIEEQQYGVDLYTGNYSDAITSNYWTVNTIDFNYICARAESEYDINSENDYHCESVNVYYRNLDANTLSVSNYTPTYSDTNLDINVYVNNIGDYNSNDFNVTLYAIEDLNTNNIVTINTWTLQDINASSQLRLNTSWIPTIDGNVDLNFVIITNETDYNSTNNYLFLDKNITVKHVDLNTTIGTINDVNAGHSRDVNCTIYNIGTANASSYDINLLVNGTTVDSNTDLSSLNASANHVETLTWTPTAKADDYNVGCLVTYSGTDYNINNNSQYTTKSVGSDSEVDLSVTDISLSSTVAGVVTITCDINNIGDENTVSDYNVKMYVDDVLLSSSDLNTQINVNAETSTTFSWTSTAGTHTLECVADYNVNNYEGYDQNLDNNSYSESFTITSATVNSPGGGGGGGSSATTEVTKDITIDANKGTASFSNSDNDGVDKVIINYNENITDALTLKLNTDPELTASDFKVILDQTVIYYLQFTYSGDQTELQNATIMFSLPKSKVTNKDLIRLGRLNNGVWTYYVPTVEDKGTYYQFTVEVPGFSYFAIVSFKELVEKDVNLITNTNNDDKNTIITNTTDNTNKISTNDTNTNKDINYLVDDYGITPGTGAKSAWTPIIGWIIGVIVCLAIIVGLYIFFKDRPRKKEFSFNSNNVKPETPQQSSI